MADITDDDRKLLEAFKALGVKPKTDSKEDLEQWMQSYVATNREGDLQSGRESVQVKTETVNADLKQQDQAVLYKPPPRLSIFSGAPGKRDSECGIDLWLYEVRCLKQQGYTESSILEAIRRSLKGEAARTAMRMGPMASLKELLDKLESVFGAVQGSEAVMAEFYTASQSADEDVAAWSCRIEDLVTRAVQLGSVQASNLDEVLRSRFWHGLRPELRDRTGHKFDSTSDFDQLRRTIRQFETDQMTSATGKTTASKAKLAQAVQQDELQAQVNQLSAQVKALTDELSNRAQAPVAGGRGMSQNGGQQYGAGGRDMSQNGGQHYGGRGRGGAWQPREEVVTCWRCGGKGHVRAGCRVRLDHTRQNYEALNDRGSAAAGKR
jgi:hypothetical protein